MEMTKVECMLVMVFTMTRKHIHSFMAMMARGTEIRVLRHIAVLISQRVPVCCQRGFQTCRIFQILVQTILKHTKYEIELLLQMIMGLIFLGKLEQNSESPSKGRKRRDKKSEQGCDHARPLESCCSNQYRTTKIGITRTNQFLDAF